MYKIANIQTTLSEERFSHERGLYKVEIPVTYWDIIFGACSRVSQNEPLIGWDRMKKIRRIEICYDESKKLPPGSKIEVEDADLEFIKERLDSNWWGTYDKNLLVFKEYMDSLKPEIKN